MTTPAELAEFIRVCRDSTLTERSGSQSHFMALCRLLDLKPPLEEDPRGEWFTFEKGAKKTGGGDGWADVWRRHCFAWEYKGKHKDLQAALRQLQQYALALENPPLLIVSDMETMEIHTNFSKTVNVVYRLTLDDLADPAKWELLRWAFLEPDRLQPTWTREAVTQTAATLLGGPGASPAPARSCAATGRAFHDPVAVLPVRRGHWPVAGSAVQYLDRGIPADAPGHPPCAFSPLKGRRDPKISFLTCIQRRPGYVNIPEAAENAATLNP